MTRGRSQLLTTGNFRDWHTVVRQISRRRVLETSVDHQSKSVQDPLRDVVQPVHEQNLHRTFKLAARGAYIVTVRGSTSCRRSDRLTCLRMGATSTATRRFLLIPLIWRRSHASSTTQSRLAGQLTRTPQPTVRLLALIDIRSPQPAPRQAVN